MTIKGWPFGNDEVAQVVTDAEWSKLFTLIGKDAVTGMVVSRTSGLGLSVAAGVAVVGGQGVEITGTETISVGTAHASLNRIDAIVLQRSLTSGSALGAATVQVVAGTPASSPVPPTLTQDAAGVWQTAICHVTVPASASALVDGNLNDVRPSPGVVVDDLEDATTVGKALATAASAAIARTTLGAGTSGAAGFVASTAIQAREAHRIFKGDGPVSPEIDDLRYRDAP